MIFCGEVFRGRSEGYTGALVRLLTIVCPVFSCAHNSERSIPFFQHLYGSLCSGRSFSPSDSARTVFIFSFLLRLRFHSCTQQGFSFASTSSLELLSSSAGGKALSFLVSHSLWGSLVPVRCAPTFFRVWDDFTVSNGVGVKTFSQFLAAEVFADLIH